MISSDAITDCATIASTGVRKRECKRPNRSLSIPSRPIAYVTRGEVSRLLLMVPSVLITIPSDIN